MADANLKPPNVQVGALRRYVTDLGRAKFLGVPSKEAGLFECYVNGAARGRAVRLLDGALGIPSIASRRSSFRI